jgi:hypothetical protein
VPTSFHWPKRRLRQSEPESVVARKSFARSDIREGVCKTPH